MLAECPVCSCDLNEPSSMKFDNAGIPWYKFNSKWDVYICKNCETRLRPVKPVPSGWVKAMRRTIAWIDLSLVLAMLVCQYLKRDHGNLEPVVNGLFAAICISTFIVAAINKASPERDRRKWQWEKA